MQRGLIARAACQVEPSMVCRASSRTRAPPTHSCTAILGDASGYASAAEWGVLLPEIPAQALNSVAPASRVSDSETESTASVSAENRCGVQCVRAFLCVRAFVTPHIEATCILSLRHYMYICAKIQLEGFGGAIPAERIVFGSKGHCIIEHL